MNKPEKEKHETAMKITEILIESGLSITNQLRVIEMVKERLKFCKETGAELNQVKLF
jgi:repressor of nif and glnA expression